MQTKFLSKTLLNQKQFLLSHGSDVNCYNNFGVSSLHVVVVVVVAVVVVVVNLLQMILHYTNV